MRVRGQFIRNLRLTFQNLALSPCPAGAAQAKERSRGWWRQKETDRQRSLHMCLTLGRFHISRPSHCPEFHRVVSSSLRHGPGTHAPEGMQPKVNLLPEVAQVPPASCGSLHLTSQPPPHGITRPWDIGFHVPTHGEEERHSQAVGGVSTTEVTPWPKWGGG